MTDRTLALLLRSIPMRFARRGSRLDLALRFIEAADECIRVCSPPEDGAALAWALELTKARRQFRWYIYRIALTN
jgi:hypothetical protein